MPGALPDELVRVSLVSAKRDFARGRVLELVEPSPQRVDPPCPTLHRGCGGCDWQHVHPSAQLDLKAEIVREALRRTARLPDAHVTTGGAVPPWAYRTSMRCSIDSTGRPGLHAARSDRVVELDACMVAHPRLADLLAELRIHGADEVSVRVSAATGDRSAWWTPESVRAVGLPAGVGTGPGAPIVEHIGGVPLRVSAESFFQSGPAAAELLVATVSAVGGDELRSAATVVDAYGGVGLFAACAVGADVDVVLVEGSASACADAQHNLAARRATVIQSSVEGWQPHPAQVVIADPSRRGLGAEAAARIIESGADVVMLVSCDPVAMARDATLLAGDYRLVTSVVLDLFPNTHHVEVVSRFERSSASPTAP